MISVKIRKQLGFVLAIYPTFLCCSDGIWIRETAPSPGLPHSSFTSDATLLRKHKSHQSL